MDDGRVVTVSYELSYTRCRHLRVLLCEIHRDLANLHIVALTALAEYVLLIDTEMVADGLQNIVDGQWLIVHLDSTLDDALSQSHVDIRVIDDGVGQQSVDDTFEVTDAAIGSLGNKLDDVSRNLQAVATTLGIEDVDTELRVRLLQFGNESASEACQQAVLHTFEVHGRTVGSQDNLLTETEQVVEDMEERVERLR